MSNKLKIILAVVAVVIVGFAVSSGHKNTNSPAGNSTVNQQPVSNAVATNSVSIMSFAFSPGDIKIKKGTTVTWTNKDNVRHTVTEVDGKTGPDSQALSGGASYKYTYNSDGVFHYHCDIHEDMLGSVTVTD